MLLKYLPSDTKYGFMKFRMAAFALSIILMIGSIALVVTRGLNFGIDFVGGVVLEVETPNQAIDVSRIQSALEPLGLGPIQVTEVRDMVLAADAPTTTAMIRTGIPKGEGEEVEASVQAMTNQMISSLQSEFEGLKIRRNEAVGPKVSGELLNQGLLALCVALGGMFVYIWFQFKWQYSVGAILALVHDIIITFGMFAVTQFEFNLSTIAALLTIVGYSMNDTVVVYDRVREELRKYKKMPVRDVIDLAVNTTLSRTILTSGTTLLALSSIFIFGGEALRGFSFAMIWGIFVGTYSSIFVASAILLHTGIRPGGNNEDKEHIPHGAQV